MAMGNETCKNFHLKLFPQNSKDNIFLQNLKTIFKNWVLFRFCKINFRFQDKLLPDRLTDR